MLGPLPHVYEQVPGLLGDPGSRWVGRDTHDADGPAGVFDEEQDVDPLAEHGVDVEQVTGKDPVGLRSQKLAPVRPGPSGCWVQAGAFEDVSHGTGRHLVSGTGEFAADALIAPRRVSRAMRSTASRMSFLVDGRPGRFRL